MTRLPFLLALVCAFVAGLLVPCAAEDALLVVCAITQDDTYDFKGTEFFTLKCGAAGSAVLSVDGDTRIAQWLRDHRAKTDIEFRPRDLARLER